MNEILGSPIRETKNESRIRSASDVFSQEGYLLGNLEANVEKTMEHIMDTSEESRRELKELIERSRSGASDEIRRQYLNTIETMNLDPQYINTVLIALFKEATKFSLEHKVPMLHAIVKLPPVQLEIPFILSELESQVSQILESKGIKFSENLDIKNAIKSSEFTHDELYTLSLYSALKKFGFSKIDATEVSQKTGIPESKIRSYIGLLLLNPLEYNALFAHPKYSQIISNLAKILEISKFTSFNAMLIHPKIMSDVLSKITDQEYKRQLQSKLPFPVQGMPPMPPGNMPPMPPRANPQNAELETRAKSKIDALVSQLLAPADEPQIPPASNDKFTVDTNLLRLFPFIPLPVLDVLTRYPQYLNEYSQNIAKAGIYALFNQVMSQFLLRRAVDFFKASS